MRKEDLKESGRILQHILTHPVPMDSEQISLLNAAKNYPSQVASSSDLMRIMQNFAKYPEAAEALVRELEMILQELESK